MAQFTGQLRGTQFHKPAQVAMMLLRDPVTVRLEREPSNKYDSNAVRVMLPFAAFNQQQVERLCAERQGLTDPFAIGHVDRYTAESLAFAMDAQGLAAVNAVMDPNGQISVLIE